MKRITKIALLTAIFLMGIFSQVAAQSTYVHLTITMNDGTEETYDMQSSSYMYFDDGGKLVITEGSEGMVTASYPLADIRKITCDELEGTPEDIDSGVVLFPNPTQNTVTFRNVRGKQNVKVYALDGRLVKSLQVIDNQIVDISDIPSGMYLVNISSNTYKMMKL